MAVTLNASTSSGFVQTADTSGIIELQNNGTTKMTIGSSITMNSGGLITSGTVNGGAANPLSGGTSVDFTSIPSWVKRITVMFNGVSTNGTSNMVVRIGSGSVSTSGYTTATSFFGGANNTAIIAYTDGWNLAGITAAGVIRGSFTLNLLDSATNAWVGTGVIYNSGSTYAMFPTGNISLAGALDRVRITMVNNIDTFDAGSINILYEG